MPFESSCSCPLHREWKHGEVRSEQLRQCNREENRWLEECLGSKYRKTRKRKICVSCRSRLEVELKCRKLEEIVSQQHENKETSTTIVIDHVGAEGPNICEVVDPMGPSVDDFVPADGNTATSIQQEEESHFGRTLVDRGTQKPMMPMMPYKNQCERRKREMRADIIETVKGTAMKYVLNVPGDLSDFLKETINSKKWHSTFGFGGGFSDESTSLNPTLVSLVNEYQESAVKEKNQEKRNRMAKLKGKIAIGNSLKDSKITPTGEKTPEHFKSRTEAASSVGRLTSQADERRRLLSIVAMDYPYRFLQDVFGCSSKTVTAAKVHSILFGRGGTPPSKFKFKRQCVSPEVLKELSEFFERDSVSRPSSCRSVVMDGEETPIRYWKDNVKELVNQYLLEFPNGVKRTYIYTHLPANFRYNTMLAGLCNICDECGHSNFEKLFSLLTEVESATAVSMKQMKARVADYQRFCKTQLSRQVERHSPCAELCMNYAFGSCEEPHDSSCGDATALYEVQRTVSNVLSTLSSANNSDKLTTELQEIMKTHEQYVGHLFRTKHQADYHKFVLDNLQPGEAVVIVDYKMKLELGVRSREAQRDWYGKRGISLHGFLVIAQISEDKKVTEVIDLWSEDTKQDAWFSQSAMDVGFRWMEKELPGFRVYLFSDNGPHYHNTAFILYLAEVNQAFNLTLVEYNNFEAGEGKSKLDTHFAHISHKIVRWVRVGNNLECGNQLGELIGSMKNVTCRKLLIDRQKAPEKVGTLKDISLYGSFEFQLCGGLTARSLAGLGKQMSKSKQQLQVIANRTSPIAGATGATRTDDIPFSINSNVQCHNEGTYSVKFVQHAAVQEQLSSNFVTPVDAMLIQSLPRQGFALKTGGGRRTLFTLAQKEIMIEFYNRQANHGIRADPTECIIAMRERGIEALKESQIKSWWSTYHQKRKREMERMEADVQNAVRNVTGNVPATSAPPAGTPTLSVSASSVSNTTSAIATSVPLTSGVTTVQASPGITVASTATSVLSTSTLSSTSVTSSPTSSSLTSSLVPLTSTPPSSSPSSVASTSLGNPSISGLTGTDTGYGITEWYLPSHISQSTIDGRNGSNACVFIALTFGMLHKFSNLPVLSEENLTAQWQMALVTAIRMGNDMHDELYDAEGVDVSVDDAVSAVGQHCQVHNISREYDIFGSNPQGQLDTVVLSILQEKPSYHILVGHGKAVLVIVDCAGNLILVDSHQHSNKGALIAGSVSCVGHQATYFAIFLNQVYLQSFGANISVCKVSTISYL